MQGHFTQHRVGGEKADVSGAFEEVAHQHVYGDLGLGRHGLRGVGERVAREAGHEHAGEGMEVLPRGVDVGGYAAHLAEQGEAVPDALELLQRLAVFVHGVHAREHRGERRVDLEAFVCGGDHGLTRHA